MKLTSIYLLALFLSRTASSVPATPTGRPGTPPSTPLPLQAYKDFLGIAHLTSLSYCIGQPEWIAEGPLQCPRVCSSLPGMEVLYISQPGFGDLFGASFIAIDRSRTSPRVHVVFRGTVRVAETVTDLRVKMGRFRGYKTMQPCRGCLVHRGFLKASDTAGKAVEEVLERRLPKDEAQGLDIVVSGHSLGAAIALFVAIQLKSRGYTVSALTFGGPRVGNEKFAQWVDRHVFDPVITAKSLLEDGQLNGFVAVAHWKDFVPSLPPYPYFPCGLAVRITSDHFPEVLGDVQIIVPPGVEFEGADDAESITKLVDPTPEVPNDTLYLLGVAHQEYFVSMDQCTLYSGVAGLPGWDRELE